MSETNWDELIDTFGSDAINEGQQGTFTSSYNMNVSRAALLSAIAKVEQERDEAVKASDTPCCECGGKVFEFTAPTVLWNMVMRHDGHETDKEYLYDRDWSKYYSGNARDK